MKKIKTLLRVRELYLELKREKARLRLESDIEKCKEREKKIAKLVKKIELKQIEHRKLELKNPEKAVRAFVMLRAMKAREQIRVAYHDGRVKRFLARYMCCKGSKYNKRM